MNNIYAYTDKKQYVNLEGWLSFTENASDQTVQFRFKGGKVINVYTPNGVQYDCFTEVTPDSTNNFSLVTEAYNVGTSDDIDLKTINYPILGWRHIDGIAYPVALGLPCNTKTNEIARMSVLDKSTKKLWRVDNSKRFESMSHYIDHYYSQLERKAA